MPAWNTEIVESYVFSRNTAIDIFFLLANLEILTHSILARHWGHKQEAIFNRQFLFAF